jgi:AcrR family transcriptional regulator
MGLKEKWLEGGYAEFAEVGPEHLSVNHIAKKIGASRSSFYHHFAEIDLFIDELLAEHWKICHEFNRVGREKCKNLIPDLYDTLAQYPVPLKFARQLFLHRHIPKYNYVFAKSLKESTDAFVLDLFARHLELNPSHSELRGLYLSLGEAWYSRLAPQDLTARTLSNHAEDIIQDLSKFMGSGVYSTLRKVP